MADDDNGDNSLDEVVYGLADAPRIIAGRHDPSIARQQALAETADYDLYSFMDHAARPGCRTDRTVANDRAAYTTDAYLATPSNQVRCEYACATR